MVTKEVAREIDEGISAAEKLVSEMPEPVRTRIVSLKAYPDEVVKRIQQIDGVIVEFEERS